MIEHGTLQGISLRAYRMMEFIAIKSMAISIGKNERKELGKIPQEYLTMIVSLFNEVNLF